MSRRNDRVASSRDHTAERGPSVLSDQRARIFGVLYLVTFVTAIAAVALFQPVLDDPAGYIATAGQDNRILFAALLELLLIIAKAGLTVRAAERGGTRPRAITETVRRNVRADESPRAGDAG